MSKIFIGLMLVSNLGLAQEDKKENCRVLENEKKHYITVNCIKGVCKEDKYTVYRHTEECVNPDGSKTVRTLKQED
jgi:hypothetical protein